jgi:hypothetical protein
MKLPIDIFLYVLKFRQDYIFLPTSNKMFCTLPLQSFLDHNNPNISRVSYYNQFTNTFQFKIIRTVIRRSPIFKYYSYQVSNNGTRLIWEMCNKKYSDVFQFP